ncbi:MAG: Flp family type IVb pilin [Verrucomicrobiota bacterium]
MLTKLVVRSKNAFWRLKQDKRGQTLVEYALILAFISVVAIFVLQALGTKVTQVFSTINNKLDEAQSGQA